MINLKYEFISILEIYSGHHPFVYWDEVYRDWSTRDWLSYHQVSENVLKTNYELSALGLYVGIMSQPRPGKRPTFMTQINQLVNALPVIHIGFTLTYHLDLFFMFIFHVYMEWIFWAVLFICMSFIFIHHHFCAMIILIVISVYHWLILISQLYQSVIIFSNHSS